HVGLNPIRRIIRLFRFWLDGRVDRRYGTDTQGRIPLREFSFSSEVKDHSRPYEPTAERTFNKMVSYLPFPARLSEFAFVDIGCGKGRTLIYASRENFRAIIGIELSPELADIAKANAKKVGDRRIKIVVGDALKVKLPDAPCVFFLYAPFKPVEMYRTLAAKIEAIHRANGKKVYVLMCNAVASGDAFSGAPFLREIVRTRWFDLSARTPAISAVWESR
ncbi:MAG: class I SAM-dependent methyltransferase, partial [Candidatus Binataceae bacterium]